MKSIFKIEELCTHNKCDNEQCSHYSTNNDGNAASCLLRWLFPTSCLIRFILRCLGGDDRVAWLLGRKGCCRSGSGNCRSGGGGNVHAIFGESLVYVVAAFDAFHSHGLASIAGCWETHAVTGQLDTHGLDCLHMSCKLEANTCKHHSFYIVIKILLQIRANIYFFINCWS